MVAELLRRNGGWYEGNTMFWKKVIPPLIILFLVSFASSAATWVVLSHQFKGAKPWKEILNLTQDQEKKFNVLEADLKNVLKESEIDEAQNKIMICSYLNTGSVDAEQIKLSAKKMAESYEKKQQKTAMALASISAILTPDQKNVFAKSLMHEVCVSCRESTGHEKCLCGSCSHH